MPKPCYFDGKTEKLKYSILSMQDYIKWAGYSPYYDRNNELNWVHIDGKIIELVSEKMVKNEIALSIKKNLTSKEYVFLNDKITKPSLYYGIEPVEISIEKDTPDRISFYFKNGIADVHKDGRVTMRNLDTLNGYLWKNSMKSMNHNFTQGSSDNVFKKFIIDVTSDLQDDGTLIPNKKRYENMISGIGYLLSTHKEIETAKCIYLTDKKSSYGEEASSTGRTGKGIIIQAIDQLRFTGQKDCKKERQDFRLSGFKDGMTCYVYQDITANTQLQMYYNEITGTFEKESKGKDIECISFEDSPKIAITANFIPKDMADVSSMGRFFIIQLENLFNATYTPFQKYGKPFFEKWDESEWNSFYNFMIECSVFYLQHGLLNYDDYLLTQKINESAINETVKNFLEEWLNNNQEIAKGNESFKRETVWKEYSQWGKNQYGTDIIKGKTFSEKKFKKDFNKFFGECLVFKRNNTGQHIWYIDLSKDPTAPATKYKMEETLTATEEKDVFLSDAPDYIKKACMRLEEKANIKGGI